MPDEPSQLAPPPPIRTARYTGDAAKSLKRHGNMAARIRTAIDDHAADPAAHANNVTQLVGSTTFRMRVGNFRVIFEQTETEITVTKVAPRGGAYDD